MPQSFDFSGKKILVTGGTRGIGHSIVSLLAEMGGEIWATGTKRPNQAVLPNGVTFVCADFSSANDLGSFLTWLKSAKIDICINNAGINKIGPFTEIKHEDFDRIIEVNLKAPFAISQAVIPHMAKMGWGRIVNISSIFGVISKEFRAPYSASKFGLDGMTTALAAEVAEKGILANCVSPGFVETDLTKEILGAEGISELTARVPIGRLAQPNEIANLAVFLASNLNTYISGQNFVIDGGYSRV